MAVRKAVNTLKGKFIRRGANTGSIRDDPWKNLKTLLERLNKVVGNFGPVKEFAQGLVECIEAYESAAQGRKDYQDLRDNLETLLGELQQHLLDSSSPVITGCITSIC
ncbi:hypothetical protein FRC11_003708, partial [Ceratobasidium sp. 423]